MSDPVDLINLAIETLHAAALDLPGFSTLDRLVSRHRADIQGWIFNRVAASIAHDAGVMLDALLIRPPNSPTTAFNRLKQVPGPARRPRRSGSGWNGWRGWAG